MQKKIKLVFFHPYSYLGGADNSLRRLIENLNLNDFSITFLSLNKSYLQNILDKKIEFKQLKAKRTLFAISEIKEILKNLKEIKIVEFDHTDVVRHPLVSKIIRAYQKKSTDDKN